MLEGITKHIRVFAPPRGKAAAFFVITFSLTAAVHFLGEQGARIGPHLFPVVNPWWMFLAGAAGFFLIPRSQSAARPMDYVGLAILLALTYWPIHAWHSNDTRPSLPSANVNRVSQPGSRPEKTVFLDSLRLPSRMHLNRLVGRRRDVSLEMNGYVLVSRSGTYRFELAVDDRCHVWIDGVSILNRRGTACKEIFLEEGTHRFRLRYEQVSGPALLHLSWDRPSILELLPLEHYLAERAHLSSSETLLHKEIQAAASLLLAMAWWGWAGCLIVNVGVELRTWRSRPPASLHARGWGKWRRAPFVVVVQLFIVVALIASAELVLSLFVDVPRNMWSRHFRLHHTRPPNRSLTFDGLAGKNPEYSHPYVLQYNDQAWVESYDIDREKPENTYRIFYVGDSFTEGAAPMDQSVPSLVEKYLNETYSHSNTHFEVINTGTMSYSPVIFYILIRYFISDYSPDLIVINVDMTDTFDDWEYRQNLILDSEGNPWAVPSSSVYDRVYIETEYGVMRATLLSKITLFLYEHSHIYNFIRRRIPVWEERKSRLQEIGAQQSDRLRSQGVYTRWSWCRYEWDDLTHDNVSFTMNMLEKIAHYCKESQIKLLLTGVPHYQQYAATTGGRPKWSHRPHSEIEKVANRAGVAYFDSHRGLAPLIEGTAQHEYYYRDDMHFNPRGFRAWSLLHIKALTDPDNQLLPESVLTPPMN